MIGERERERARTIRLSHENARAVTAAVARPLHKCIKAQFSPTHQTRTQTLKKVSLLFPIVFLHTRVARVSCHPISSSPRITDYTHAAVYMQAYSSSREIELMRCAATVLTHTHTHARIRTERRVTCGRVNSLPSNDATGNVQHVQQQRSRRADKAMRVYVCVCVYVYTSEDFFLYRGAVFSQPRLFPASSVSVCVCVWCGREMRG